MNGTGKTVWIFAGESSGDNYGARLARELKAQAPELTIRGMGGLAMRDAGVDIMVDSSRLGVVGLVEVLRHFALFYRLFHSLVRRAAADRPDAVVLIDYPGFNLRFAKRLKALGIPVVYYISPQVWAWGRRRIPEIARTVRKMLVIFPFEPGVYAGTGLDTEFVGHPLLEILAEKRQTPVAREANTVLLLPGSRHSEIERLLVPLYQTAAWLHQRHPELRFVLATPNADIRAGCQRLMDGLARGRTPVPVETVVGCTHEWMQRATVGLAASGTVTMEAAIMHLPLVVVYRLNPLTFQLGRLLVRVPFITIVNLVTNRKVYEEFLQGDVRPELLGPALERVLPGGSRCAEVDSGMSAAVAAVSSGHRATENAARAVLGVINA